MEIKGAEGCHKKMEKACLLKEASYLLHLEGEINHLLYYDTGIMRTPEEEIKLKELELNKNNYLKRKE